MEISASVSSSFSLKSGFSDQSHLIFYGGTSSAHLRPLKTHLQSTMACSASSPLTALPPAQPPRFETGSCNTLLQELALLKAQVKVKKKQLKAMEKEKKKAMKEMKPKVNKRESSSSSSESCDEGSASVNTRLWKKGSPSSMQGVAGADNLHGLHSDADQARSLQNLSQSSSSLPAETTLNGLPAEITIAHQDFSFKLCTENPSPIKNSAHHGQDSEAPAPCGAATAVATHGSRRAHADTGRVEVCAGGKCKKAGSQQLLSSLRSQIPASASVEAMPCKCMGNCASGINVRVRKDGTNPQDHSHVGVDDAGFLLSHHFGSGPPPSGLPRLPSFASPSPTIHRVKV